MQIAEGEDRPVEELLALPEEEAQALVTDKAFVFIPPGAGTYTTADLDPGRYVAICFVPVGATPRGAGGGRNARRRAALHARHGGRVRGGLSRAGGHIRRRRARAGGTSARGQRRAPLPGARLARVPGGERDRGGWEAAEGSRRGSRPTVNLRQALHTNRRRMPPHARQLLLLPDGSGHGRRPRHGQHRHLRTRQGHRPQRALRDRRSTSATASPSRSGSRPSA